MIYALKNYVFAFFLTALFGVLLYARVGFQSHDIGHEALILFAFFMAFKILLFPNFNFRTVTVGSTIKCDITVYEVKE